MDGARLDSILALLLGGLALRMAALFLLAWGV